MNFKSLTSEPSPHFKFAVVIFWVIVFSFLSVTISPSVIFAAKGDVSRNQSPDEVLGWAETHLHPFANEGFGGGFISGKPFHYDPSGPNNSNAQTALHPPWKPTFPPLNWG